MYTINYVCYLNLLLCHHFKVVVLYSTALSIILRSYFLMKNHILYIYFTFWFLYQRYCLCKTLETHSKIVISIFCINPTVPTVMDIGTRVLLWRYWSLSPIFNATFNARRWLACFCVTLIGRLFGVTAHGRLHVYLVKRCVQKYMPTHNKLHILHISKIKYQNKYMLWEPGGELSQISLSQYSATINWGMTNCELNKYLQHYMRTINLISSRIMRFTDKSLGDFLIWILNIFFNVLAFFSTISVESM